ncbi:MAG: EF-P lysine aminoacylase EpmA [Lacipirellulaceae bacterium]
MSSLTRRENLQRRAQLLKETRRFFDERGFLEVETPLVSAEVIPELHIEPRGLADGNYFLQASPELHMKRLLCEEFESIYQVTRSFRGHESGRLHSPEFTIVEWYRVGEAMNEGIGLLDQFLQTVAGTAPAKRTSYQEAFQKELNLDPHTASCDELADKASEKRLAVPDDLKRDDRDEWLNLLLSFCIEPTLGNEVPEILYDYPQSQAALAKVKLLEDETPVARRFELYWRGVELANGYDELTDAVELRERLLLINGQRESEGRPALPLPESLFEVMSEPGLPPCSGCALGFDRLAMLVCGCDSIGEVRSFPS